MAMEIDTFTAKGLSDDIKQLSTIVTELRVTLSQFGPILQGQVNGLANTENRVTRLEDRCTNLEKRTEERQLDSDRRSDDRFTAIERTIQEKFTALDRRMAEDKAEAEKRKAEEKAETDKRITTNRWLIGITIPAVGMLIALTLFLLQHVKISP